MITGVAAWTAAGRGVDALSALLSERGTAFSEAPPYAAEGLSTARCARIAGLDRRRPAAALLVETVRSALAQAGLSGSSAGLVVGTSSGDICGPWEDWHRAALAGDVRDEVEGPRQAITDSGAALLGLAPATTVSIACASGTAALAVAAGWLADGRAPAVVICGVDALSLYIHAGFSGLGALSADRPRPFSAERDGLLLGEGAGALVIEPAASASRRGAAVLAELAGVGLSADAVHMTAPDRQGGGAARAMQAALADAGVGADTVDLVSVHATGTVFNDAMEGRALSRVFGDRPLDLFGVKQAIGHTLGATGAIEAAVVVSAICEGAPPPGPAGIDPELGLPEAPGRAPRVVVSTNSAFGGANAAAVLAAPGALPPLRRRDVKTRIAAHAMIRLAADERATWTAAPDRFRRMNRFVRVGVLLCRDLFAQVAPTADTGVVLVSATNCRGADLRYHRRLVERGAARAPRVEFIYTVPGAPAGEAAILWKLTGPSLVLCDDGGLDQAVCEAERLVRRGRADRLVAMAVEAPGRGCPARGAAVIIVRERP